MKTTKPSRIQIDARRYISAIRNAAKQEYAHAYAAWMDGDRTGPEPDRPEGLSFMGGQAVRLNLYEYDYYNN